MSDPEWDPAEVNDVNNLLEWIRTLPSMNNDIDVADLRMGKPIAEALHIIDPTYFDESFLEKVQIYNPHDSNWRVLANNIRKVHNKLREYYDECLRLQLLPEFEWHIDTDEIGHLDGDIVNLRRLLTLVLGVAFLGPNKATYIHNASQLPSSNVQMTIMNKIKILQQCPEVVSSPVSPQGSGILSPHCIDPRLSIATAIDDEWEAKCNALNNKISELTREKESLSVTVTELKGDIADLSKESDSGQKEIRDLKELRARLEEQMADLDGVKEALRMKCIHIEEENNILKEKVASFIPFEEEFRRCKDELEEYRVRDSETRQKLNTLEQWKSKAKENNDLLAEVKLLREKSDGYLKVAVDFEEEQNKTRALRQQIGSLKAHLTEKDADVHKLSLKLDTAQFDVETLTAKLKAVESEKLRICERNRELEEEIVMVNATHTGNVMTNLALDRKMSLVDDMASVANENGNNHNDESERIMKLQEEINRLRAGESEELEQKEEELDKQRGRVRELECEVRLLNKKVLELQAKVEECDKWAEGGVKSNGEDEIRTLKIAAEKASLEADKMKERADRSMAETKKAMDSIEPLNARIAELERSLEEEKASKLEYLAKAKSIIDDQERNATRATEGGACSMHEFNSMRKEIEMKDKVIRHLEEKLDSNATMFEQEHRLVTTAFHSLAQTRLPNTVEPPPSSSSPDSGRDNRSFLSRQKQHNALNLSVFTWFIIIIVVGVTCWTIGSSTTTPYPFHSNPPLYY